MQIKDSSCKSTGSAPILLEPKTYIAVTLVWTIIGYSISFSWYVGGFIILLSPIYGSIVLLYQMIARKKKLIRPYGILAVVYFAYVMILHLFHGDFAFHGIGDLMTSVFFIVNLLETDKEEYMERIRVFAMTMLIISIAYALITILFTYCVKLESIERIVAPDFIKDTAKNWISSPIGRLKGIGGNSNSTGHWCAYGLVFGTFYLFTGKVKPYILLLHFLSIFLTTFILLKTASRAAILTYAIALVIFSVIYFTFLRSRTDDMVRKYLAIAFSLAIAIFVICCAMFFLDDFFKMKVFSIARVKYYEGMPFHEILDSIGQSLRSASHRDVLRKQTMDLWRQHWIFGVSTDAVVESFNSTIASKTGAHNVFIQVLATTGIAGFIMHVGLWMLSLYAILHYVAKGKDRELHTVALLILSVIPALFFDNLYETYLYTSITIMAFCGFFMLASGAQLMQMEKAYEKN